MSQILENKNNICVDGLVSILTPCFNGEKYIGAFFDSVLRQDYHNIELIFVDDGSTDKTFDICKRYEKIFDNNDISFIYIYQENRGQAAAINAALPIFKGEFICWFDSDDIMFPNAISKKVDYLNSHNEIDFVLSQGIAVNETNLDKTLFTLKRNHSKNKKDDLFFDLIEEKNVVFAPGTIMVKSSYFYKKIPQKHIYESNQGQNFQMMLPLAYKGKYGYIDEPLFKYVVHEDSHCHRVRDYNEEILRCDEFKKTILYTVCNIPNIEKDKLNDINLFVEKIFARKKLHYSLKNDKKIDIRKYRKELKKCDKLKYYDYKIGYVIYCFIDIILYKIKICLEKYL